MRSPRPNRSGRVIGRARGEAFRRFMLRDVSTEPRWRRFWASRHYTPVYLLVGIMALGALGLAALAGWPAWMALLSGAPWTSEVSWIGARSGRPVVARVSLLASWSAVAAVAALVVVAVCIHYHRSGDQDHGGQ